MKRCLTILLLIVVAFVVLVRSLDRTPKVPETDYAGAISRTDPVAVQLGSEGVPAADQVFTRFGLLWSNLTAASVAEHATNVYAEAVWFNDTLKTFEGRPAVADYLDQTARRVDACTVEIVDVASSGVEYYVRWRMTVLPPETDPADAWRSIGVTHMRFDREGRVLLHQDYWDAAGGLYEHLPGIGWILRNIRARL
ncbi:MAG TPA: nuclear transport factor 2 family protein [Kiritimatiellia bacterium]|nr:nuclear transport factor 2 family protein [Kiritimatiellia bacterium]HMP34951.1 nuclear transport factor 2 family protein [Kiritimatiellia bacterium]